MKFPLNLCTRQTKILVLGDSVSWGDCILDLNLVYPQILESELQAKGSSCQIFNASVPGYSTFQELKYLETEGMKLKPDAIFLQFCLNDVVERYKVVFEYGGTENFMGIDTKSSVRGLYGFMLEHSSAFETLVRPLRDLCRNVNEYEVSQLCKDSISPEIHAAWRENLSEIEKIRNIAADSKIPFIILIMPFAFQLDSPEEKSQPQKLLSNFAKDNNIPAIDFLPYFSEFKKYNPDIPIFADQSHLSPAGHRLVTDIILASFPEGKICGEKLIPIPPSDCTFIKDFRPERIFR